MPASKELLRLTVSEAGDGGNKILLWSGPREEVREEGESPPDSECGISVDKRTVKVSAYRPRLRFLPVLQMNAWDAWARLWRSVSPTPTNSLYVNRLHSYLEMAALSLYFLNLLPLPYLDGMELVKTLRIWMSESRESWRGAGAGDLDRERVV